jgi:anti-sigma B factor antagonist
VTELHVSSELVGGGAHLALHGELDLSTVDVAQAALDALERESGAAVVVLYLRTAGFMDSTGVHFVLRADARVSDRGGRLVIVRGPERVDRVFRLAHLDQRLELLEDPDELGDRDDLGDRETTGA